jgi:hypothetical protein
VNGTYYRQVFGGTLPGPIWQQSMQGALEGRPITPFNLTSSYGFSASNPGVRSNVPRPAPAPRAPSTPEFTLEDFEPELPPAPEPVAPPVEAPEVEFGPDTPTSDPVAELPVP